MSKQKGNAISELEQEVTEPEQNADITVIQRNIDTDTPTVEEGQKLAPSVSEIEELFNTMVDDNKNNEIPSRLEKRRKMEASKKTVTIRISEENHGKIKALLLLKEGHYVDELIGKMLDCYSETLGQKKRSAYNTIVEAAQEVL
ncbi:MULTISPECIES: hypothetical protein [Pseudobacillus]|uniref:hypothetical protein n=1 Tax=Pseudobacillus TaxID=108525 RepID=UPI00387A5521